MAQTNIIVDTSSYFRLAQNIHPLLCQPFGEEDYTLYMHADLNAELRGSPRLQTKFDWAANEEFRENRKRSLPLSRKQKVEQVVAQWQFDNDTPYKGWEAEYKRLFKQVPPGE